MFAEVKQNLRADIPFIELDNNINDTTFAEKAVDMMLELISRKGAKTQSS